MSLRLVKEHEHKWGEWTWKGTHGPYKRRYCRECASFQAVRDWDLQVADAFTPPDPFSRKV